MEENACTAQVLDEPDVAVIQQPAKADASGTVIDGPAGDANLGVDELETSVADGVRDVPPCDTPVGDDAHIVPPDCGYEYAQTARQLEFSPTADHPGLAGHPSEAGNSRRCTADEKGNWQESIGTMEAILWMAGETVPATAFAQVLQLPAEDIPAVADALADTLDSRRAGVMLMRYGASYQLVTRPCYAEAVRAVLTPPQSVSLSTAAMETLSVIAYRQPISRMEVESLRGVKCDYTLSTLVQKGLIQEVGRTNTLGRAILYGTTERFLQHFGLPSTLELPGRAELQLGLQAIDQREEDRIAAAQMDAAFGAEEGQILMPETPGGERVMEEADAEALGEERVPEEQAGAKVAETGETMPEAAHEKGLSENNSNDEM